MKNSKGMTFIELLMVVGIMGIISLSLPVLAQLVTHSAATAEDSQQLTSLKYEVNGALNHANSCKTIIEGKTSVNDTPLTIGSIASGATYGKLTISSVTMKNIVNVGGLTRKADVEISGSKRADSIGSHNFVTRYSLYYLVDGGNIMTNCLTVRSNANDSCEAMGGTVTNGGCNFCLALGGSMLNGQCQLKGHSYFWQADSWGSCKNGSQTRSISCHDTETLEVVDSSRCTQTAPPLTRVCSSYSWEPSAWSSCNNKQQTRTAVCKDNSSGASVTVADANCTDPISLSQVCDDAKVYCIPIGDNFTSGPLTSGLDAGLNSAQAHINAITDPEISATDKEATKQGILKSADFSADASVCTIEGKTNHGEYSQMCRGHGSSGKLSWEWSNNVYKLDPHDCGGSNCTTKTASFMWTGWSCSNTPP